MMAMSYGIVYVARVAIGANDSHTVKAFQEAEACDGPSIIIAYSHCIAHGYDLTHGLDQQKAAVNSGYWPLMRYNPAVRAEGKNPFFLDSRAPSIPLKDYIYNESRYTQLQRAHPDTAAELLQGSDRRRGAHLARLRQAAPPCPDVNPRPTSRRAMATKTGTKRRAGAPAAKSGDQN